MDKYEPWTCDVCTAGCTFEALEWCAKRRDPSALCGHDRDNPLACHAGSTRAPDREGAFEFVQLGTYRDPSPPAERWVRPVDDLPLRDDERFWWSLLWMSDDLGVDLIEMMKTVPIWLLWGVISYTHHAKFPDNKSLPTSNRRLPSRRRGRRS